jgi:ribosome-associated heat shock protein Hsp15
MSPVDEARVDSWLWSVRIYKTRTAATDACSAGHVRVNGKSAKPATQIRSGDTVTVRSHGLERVLEVVTVVNKRVGAPLAAEYAIDRTPPLERSDEGPAPFARERSAGRPTKKDRRRLDRLRRG